MLGDGVPKFPEFTIDAVLSQSRLESVRVEEDVDIF
jgi:hypothetical protein